MGIRRNFEFPQVPFNSYKFPSLHPPPLLETAPSFLSLRRVLLNQGVDLRRCRSCGVCSETVFPDEEADLALGIIVQLVLLNDPEVFTSRSIWSDTVLETANTLCPNGIDLSKVIHTLREEAIARGFT